MRRVAGKKSKMDVLFPQDPGLVPLFLIVRLKDRELSVDKLLADLERRGVGGITARTVQRWLRSFVKQGYVREVAGRRGVVVPTSMGKKLATEARVRLEQLIATTA